MLIVIAFISSNVPLLSLHPSITGSRVPLEILCLVDTSASTASQMSKIAKGWEPSGFTILDTVKQAVNTVIQNLGPGDFFGLKFMYGTVMPLAPVTPQLQDEAAKKV